MLYNFSVNYRGSIGFGQDSIGSLLGNIGTQDVLDVKVIYNISLSLTGTINRFFLS